MKNRYKIIAIIIVICMGVCIFQSPQRYFFTQTPISESPSVRGAPLKELIESNISTGSMLTETGPRVLARSSNGTLYTVYLRSGVDICYASSTNNGSSWSENVINYTVSGSGYQESPTIAIDSNDTIYVFWEAQYDEESDTTIMYDVYNATSHTWKGATSFYSGQKPSIVVDENNNIQVVWLFAYQNLYGARYNYNASYISEEVSITSFIGFDESVSGPSCVAVNSTNIIHVVFLVFDINTGTKYMAHTFYDNDTDTWNDTEKITINGDTWDIGRVSMAIDSFDKIHLSITNFTWDGDMGMHSNGRCQYISYNRSVGKVWSTEFTISTGSEVSIPDDGGQFTTISVDDGGVIHVVWVGIDTEWFMMYNTSTDNGTTWTSTYNDLFEFPYGRGPVHPNMIYAFYPNETTNIPESGYAFVYELYDVDNDSTNISYYANCTWEAEVEETSPSVSDPNPPIGATGISVDLGTVNVTITQTDGDLFNWTIQGSFLTSNSSTSSTTGVKQANITGSLVAGTLYTWWVNASDNDGWNNKTYYFTTKSNQVVIFYSPNPANHSTGVSLTQPDWNITIQDPDGDTFNYSIEMNPDVGGSFGYDNTNGSKNATLSGLSANTNYTVYVNATDNGTDTSVNATFWFITNYNHSVVFSYPNPANGSTEVPITTALWNVTIQDPEGDSFNYSIETNPNVGGSYGYDHSNGSKSCVLAGLNYSINYTVYVNATDNATYGGNGTSINQTFWFLTEGPIPTVYVDKSYTAATPDYGTINFSTIHEAVENVTVGGNVIVYYGFYIENVFIAKQINITGSYTSTRPNLNGSSASNHSITIQGAYNVTITGLNISNALGKAASYNAIQIGTLTDDSYYISINNCTLKNSFSGISVRPGDHDVFSNCTIFGNNYGINLVGPSSCSIVNNNINNNSVYGVYINSIAPDNVIDNNSINYNTLEGIRITGLSTGNWIFHNNFVNNNIGGKQSSDSFFNTNYWNLSYPQCGNYWGDWDTAGEGVYDRWWGPLQNINGSDGIADGGSPNPYNFTTNQDNYPFILPFNGTPATANPNITGEVPINNSGNASIWLPNVSINITSILPFCYNITGSFLNGTFNNGTWVSTGTFTANVSNPLLYNTQYVWYVNATDGNHSTNATYYFWTNRPPVVTGENPSNGSTTSIVTPYCNITVNDTDGDTFDICFYQNTSGTWTLNQSNASVTNGTYYWNYSNATITGTAYWWLVTVNDTHTNITYMFYFIYSAPRVWQNVNLWNVTIYNKHQDIESWTVTISNQTHGGVYNITIRFENETEGINHRVNLEQTNTGINKFIIHYDDGIDYVYFNHNGVLGTHYNTIDGYYNNNQSGNFTVIVNKWVKFFEFRWNDTVGRQWYCTRYIVPTSNNVTMYIRTDLPVYGESSGYFNNSLVKYHMAFNDETGKFMFPNNPYSYIYTYNSSGVRQIIHAEYMDSTGRIYPWLVYNEKYFIGVACDIYVVDRIGDFVASDTIDVADIRIPFQNNISYSIYDLCTITAGWYASGFYVNYTDTTSSTSSLDFSVYNYLNGTFLHGEIISSDNTYNFTYTIAEGCFLTSNYSYQINATLNGLINPLYAGYYSTNKLPMIAHMSPITDNTSLDKIFTIIFGPSPIYDYNNPSVYVPWSYILVFAICFVLMASFGKLNAFIGGLTVGMFLLFVGSFVTGMQILYQQYPGWPGVTVIVIGAFIVAISVISLLGGVEKR